MKRGIVGDRGNVALIVALCAPLVITTVGFAVDYGYATYVKQGLQSAADAAVLAATSQAAATAAGGYSNTAWLTNYGSSVFKSNIAKLPVSNVSPNISVTSNGSNGVIASATYSYQVPTFLSGIIGISNITVSGKANATANPLTYINYYILVDISQSMGIAATQSDMNVLYNRVASYGMGTDGEPGCVFGCHVAAPGMPYTNEYLAHNMSPKVTLRIDSAVAAIQSVINAAQTAAGTNQNIKIGLYTMSKNPNNGTLVTTIAAPTFNYNSLITSANTIDLGDNNGAVGYGDSDFTDQFPAFISQSGILNNGSGASAASPQNYVFIITDGMSDTPGWYCTWGHCDGTLNPPDCNQLKAKATVGVVYTTYIPIYNYVYSGGTYVPGTTYDYTYTLLAAPYVSSIPSALQSCATSSNYYYEATNGPAITAGMQSLFASSLQTAHLTQ
jgi:Flp pilus assembly protein TadG